MKKAPVLLGVAGLVATATLAFVFLRRAAPHAGAPAIPGPPASEAVRMTRSECTRPLQLADPAHVDVLDAYAAARAAVLEIEPGAELFGISATGLSHGTLDFSSTPPPDAGQGRSLFFQFERAGAADGGAGVRRHIEVEVKPGGLRITSVEGPVFARGSRGRSLAALDEPTCPSRRAWAAAVESGAPEDATATLLLRGGDGRLVWSLHVVGYPLKHREIDARTCALVTQAP